MDRTEIIKTAIEKAERLESKLTPEILDLEGMSSAKIRHLLNNIMDMSKNSRYLEVGIWKGSTFISSLFENWFDDHYLVAVGIENFTEFIFRKEELYSLLSKHIDWHGMEGSPVSIIESDFKAVDYSPFGKFDIYLYDGGHSIQDHYDAFKILDPYLADEFIAIVDDWNMEAAKAGTRKAFEELKYEVVYEIELPADYNGDFQKWWDGFYVAHIKKGLT